MNEFYLEWMFLREHIGKCIEPIECIKSIDLKKYEHKTYVWNGKVYDLRKLLKKYFMLNDLLLKNYEV